jgi:hypothetical protein
VLSRREHLVEKNCRKYRVLRNKKEYQNIGLSGENRKNKIKRKKSVISKIGLPTFFNLDYTPKW